MKIAVYTSITGGFENKLRTPLVSLSADVDLICFSECIGRAPYPWKLLPPVWEHSDPRRTSRYHKVNPHIVLPDYDYWLWMDGNQQLAESPEKLIGTYLPKGTNFASYKHPDRSTLQEELAACIKLDKDDQGLMESQIAHYAKEGYPDVDGLLETTVVLRRKCHETDSVNDDWWDEIHRGSRRDQLSLPFVLWKWCVVPGIIKGQRDNPVHFKYFAHR